MDWAGSHLYVVKRHLRPAQHHRPWSCSSSPRSSAPSSSLSLWRGCVPSCQAVTPRSRMTLSIVAGQQTLTQRLALWKVKGQGESVIIKLVIHMFLLRFTMFWLIFIIVQFKTRQKLQWGREMNVFCY